MSENVLQPLLKLVSRQEIGSLHSHVDPVDSETLIKTKEIVDAVKREGDDALVRYSLQFGDLKQNKGETIQDLQKKSIFSRSAMAAVYETLPSAQKALLERTSARIRAFAEKQKESISELVVGIEGGLAGHFIEPVEIAG